MKRMLFKHQRLRNLLTEKQTALSSCTSKYKQEVSNVLTTHAQTRHRS